MTFDQLIKAYTAVYGSEELALVQLSRTQLNTLTKG